MQTAMNAQLLGQLIVQAETQDKDHELKVGREIEEAIRCQRQIKEQVAEELDDFLLHGQTDLSEIEDKPSEIKQ